MSAISPGALLVCYLAATSVVLLTGWSSVYAGGVIAHVAVLMAIAAATWMPGVPRWLRAWAPLLALLFLYAEIPMLVRAIGHSGMYDDTVISWEAAIFRGQPSREWAGRWHSRPLSELLHAAYLTYYPIIFAVPVILWFRRRHAEFAEAVFATMLTFVACLVWYLLFPVAGPRYLWLTPIGAIDGPIRTFTLKLLQAGSARGTAFPSSHVAIATTQTIVAVRFLGCRGLSVGVLTIGLGIGAVYGGFHYAVDVVAGALLGAIVTGVALLVLRILRVPPSQANASAPT